MLANGGRKISKSDLLRSYDWLSVGAGALESLDSLYRRAYGGVEEVGGIEGMGDPCFRVFCEPVIWNDEGGCFRDPEKDEIGLAVSTLKSPSPKISMLKIQTKFNPPSRQTRQQEDGEETAHPLDKLQLWPDSSLDSVVSSERLMPPPTSSMRSSYSSSYMSCVGMGPTPPNGYDISPTTRGEWGLLTRDDAFQGCRTVAVEIF